MGCKLPKPGSQASAGGGNYGPQRRGKGAGTAAAVSPYGGGKQNFSAARQQPWECACGFSNKPLNQVCGGTGPMGCKSPKPGSEGQQKGAGKLALGAYGLMATGAAEESSYGPQRRAKSSVTVYASPYAKGGAAAVTGTVKAIEPGEWLCRCGFRNKATNTQCGGTGNMGCNAPKEWQCLSCGFNNKAANEVCGGKGNLGCKSPWQFSSMGGMGKMAHMGMMQMGKGMPAIVKPGGGSEWECSSCGFKNKASNTQCGGTGPMGCNLPRPEVWICPDCNFKNKPNNEVCGGTGNLGCKAAKPAA